jgi:hypothetical protein
MEILHETRTDLQKISTYASEQRKSTTWIYKEAKKGNIKLVVIDGVKFVKIK